MSSVSVHESVLLQESIDAILRQGYEGQGELVIVDGTFGGGGHSLEICKKYPGVKIIALDQDAGAWKRAQKKFNEITCNINFQNANFRDIDKVLERISIKEVDGVLLDLGLSSDQLEQGGRGFSFMRDEPLLMTMKENPQPEDLTARDVVNTWSEKSLADIIYGYGEEKYSRKIARGIVESREEKPIETSFDLVRVIESSVPAVYRRGRMHCATRTFQAIRMAVNDELGALEEALKKGFEALKPGGRMSIITFHSLEDRIVKKFFKSLEVQERGNLINKRVIVPKEEEVKKNPRSRSAKLRTIEKISEKIKE